METIFGNDSYLGSGRWNNIFVKLVKEAYPFGGDVVFLTSHVPRLAVIYGLTSGGYFEGTFTTSAMGTPKNYVSYRYLPHDSIRGYFVKDGVLHFDSDSRVENHFVPGINAGDWCMYGTAILEPDFENMVSRIEQAQAEKGCDKVALISAPEEHEPEPEERNVGDQTDELLKAKSLLDIGAISQEEFAELKKKILGL